MFNDRIRHVKPSGIIVTVAGGGSGGDGGPAVEARLNEPRGVEFDRAGNLYIADSSSHRVRRVDATGAIATVAGTGETGYGGDDGPAVHAMLNWPSDMAVDAGGNLYIADTRNHRVRRVDRSGTITTVAGTGWEGHGGDGGPAVEARMYYPDSVAIDRAGNLFIADAWNQRIRRVDASGIITTIAGTGEMGHSGNNGLAVEAQLNGPAGVDVDGAGNLYIADTWNDRIRRVDRHGIITRIAGLGAPGFGGEGGPARLAPLRSPNGVDVDALGNLLIADTSNHRIRQVNPSGTITTIAGPPRDTFFVGGFRGDGGPATDALLRRPEGVAVDAVGNIYIADTANNRIRIVTRTAHPRILQAPTRLVATSILPLGSTWTGRTTAPMKPVSGCSAGLGDPMSGSSTGQ